MYGNVKGAGTCARMLAPGTHRCVKPFKWGCNEMESDIQQPYIAGKLWSVKPTFHIAVHSRTDLLHSLRLFRTVQVSTSLPL